MSIATRVNGVAPAQVPLSDIDLASAEFWLEDDDVRDGAFATLRREAPVSFWREPPAPGFTDGPGHWAVTRFDDVHFASRHPEIYSSHPNIGINDFPSPEIAEFFGSMITLDDPGISGCATSSVGRSRQRWWPASRSRYAIARVGSSTT